MWDINGQLEDVTVVHAFCDQRDKGGEAMTSPAAPAASYGHNYMFMSVYSGTGLESRFLEAAFNNSGDLCSIRQISQFRTFKMIIHDYHNMQHHMAMP